MPTLRINIVLFGIGNVGSTLINQVLQAQDFFLQQKNIELRFPIITNSTLAFFEKEGVKNQWEANFAQSAIPFRIEDIIEYVQDLELDNLIAVDATASEDIIKNYIPLIQAGFHIVAANKKANTLHYDFYKELRSNLKRFDRKFLYETNVGAGLPVINTIKNLFDAGEEITQIRGVFSGTLSYLFNRFGEEDVPFATLLKEAEQFGYTEPDSREDLSGNDVARKLLILARELGSKAEFSSVKIESLLIPELATNLTLKEYRNQQRLFNKPFQIAKITQADNHVLRYVGNWNRSTDTLEVQLISVPRNSPLGQLKGADNLIEIYTESYGKQPIIIQGAGAGKAVTARGVLSDIIQIADTLVYKEQLLQDWVA
ncbi:homoserine dehydrogenase family protein [Flavobacterium stagni]|uniref:aspartate kinase n=1 Tax=Flavobacterium stagni TaxID=2506421 RepID=UPI0019D6C8A1|nr:aspartate kinase [Flavobacterium stagni]